MRNLLTLMISLVVLTAKAQEVKDTLPLSFCNGVPVVKLEVNKKKVMFLLDTGASHSLIDMGYRDELELEAWEVARRDFEVVGGHPVLYGLRKLLVRNTKGYIIHIIFRGAQLGYHRTSTRIAGILGGDFFEKGWMIDYENERLIKLK